MGLLITFEGGEGSGKSYQAKVLFNKLTKLGLPVIHTHEPGGTALGDKITRLLKWANNTEISGLAELFLFNASRSQLVDEIITPALKSGQIVICDRFTDSTIVYQGYARGLDLELTERLNNIATRGLKPDLTILLDIPVDKGLARKSKQQADRFHRENTVFHRKVRKGFLERAKAEPKRWLVIDAGQPRVIISRQIWEHISKLVNV